MGNYWLVIIFITVLVFMSFLSSRNRKKKIIFFGDSITKAGTQSHGYITMIQDILDQQNINKYELIAEGVNGNKIYDLYLRMDKDVLAKTPHIVVVFIGVNDVWHKRSHGTGTDLEKFEKFYYDIISKIRAAGAKMIVCTPAVIGEKYDQSNDLDNELEKFCDVIRNLSTNFHLPLVDLRKSFIEYETKNNLRNIERGILTVDGVHLNEKGNEMVAESIWNVLKEIK